MINTGEEQVASDDISHREKREDRIEDHEEAQYQPQDLDDQSQRVVACSRSQPDDGQMSQL